MDPHDGPDAAGLARMLEFRKANLAKARSKKGQRPKSTEPREEIIMQFMFQHMTHGNPDDRIFHVRTSIIPPAYPPSVQPLAKLKKAMLKRLTLETHHRGSYIVLRAVTPTITFTGTMLIVEDEVGDVVKLTLYNQQEDLTTHGRLVEGTVMIIKEPYLKVAGDGGHAIRVDHISDIIFLSEHDSRVPVLWEPRVINVEMSANDWKLNGNDRFSKDDYGHAIDLYAKALDSSPTAAEATVLRLNRALACLRAHRFDAALSDLDIVLEDNETSEKALFRKAQALYYLHRFQECCEIHEILAKHYPRNEAAKDEFKRGKARLKEQKTGKYDFKRMQLEAKKLSTTEVDHATYIGPVAVKHAGSAGRGVFTTADVKAGDLLFCEKAYAQALQDNQSHEISTLINLETNKVTTGTHADLITMIVRKMYNNPSLAPKFTNLYHGSYKPVNASEVDENTVVDTFLVERTMSLNAFGCLRSTRGFHLETLLSSSNFGALAGTEPKSAGIWCLASYMNHSCYDNAYRSFIGDMMIVRACQDLPANTEVTVAYSPPSDDSKDPGLFKQQWGFTCNCALCLDARNTRKVDVVKRETLTTGLKKAFGKTKPNISMVQTMLAALDETYRYPASEVPRLKACGAYFALSRFHLTQCKPKDAVAAALKGFESMGYIIERGQVPTNGGPQAILTIKKWGLMEAHLIGSWMALALAYRGLGSNLAAAAEHYARITYRICIGEDETFDDTYSKFSNRLDGFLESAK
ncbi:TPR domain protein [Aspergillus stella-maris]|uniref:TPR domain protein n=1 Tax=Aspergillus stella-maris TaxID=1810926 RepID=UPI003CCD8DA1